MWIHTDVELLAVCETKVAGNVSSPNLCSLSVIPGVVWKSSGSLHSVFAYCLQNDELPLG